MNNDNFNQNDKSEDKSTIRGQQFYPGRGPTPPPFQRDFPDDQQFPGMGNQPRTAPPNFIPEAPSMERRQMQGPSDYGVQYRDGGQFRHRELRRCLYRFTYIWLDNGNNFWFFPTFVGRQFVEGFRWRRNRWEYDRINLRRIFFSRCY